jgi:hypothetical protein
MTTHRLTSMEFFRNCYLYAFFLLPLPLVFLFTGAPYWSHLLWAMFIAMAARIETLKNNLIVKTIEKESFEFRFAQSERVLCALRSDAEQSKASLLSWISALEKLSEEQRKEIHGLRRPEAHSSSPEPREFEIAAYGNDQPSNPATDVNRAA